MMDVIENWALHAYADGELESEDKSRIEKLLASDPQARRVFAEIQQQKAELHKSYDGVLDENVPAHLMRAARHKPLVPRRNRWAIAAALAAMLVGGVAGWSLRSLDGGVAVAEALQQRALDAFTVYSPEVRHPVEVAAADKEHLQAWLSKRVGTAFTIPDLSAQGYTLVGGRLLTNDASPAGMLMYEDQAKRRLVVYVAANRGQTGLPLTLAQHGALVTCVWIEPHLAYAVAGPQSQTEMMPLAQALHEGFDRQG